MRKEKDKNRGASPSSYGTFQGVPTYPPPSYPHHPPSHRPVTGFPQPSPPPGSAHHNISVHQYIQQHQTVPGYPVSEGRPTTQNRLPCCGLGIGWFLFIIGFILGTIPWYIGVFILVSAKIDSREKPGYIACTIASDVVLILHIYQRLLGFIVGVLEMVGILATFPSAMRVSLRNSCPNRDNADSIYHFPLKFTNSISVLQNGNHVSSIRKPSLRSNSFLRKRHYSEICRGIVKSAASSTKVGNADEYVEETATSVKFQRSVTLPGCSSSLSLLGTGFREKKFAIIGVKVYAAGYYVNESILSGLSAWKGRSSDEIQRDSSLFGSIFEVQAEKSLEIVLVRDVDGKTFWDALDEAISPRIKSPSSDDQTALSTFRNIFQNRPLNKGSVILLTWINPSKMLVSVSSGELPTDVDATIESGNVTFALFDVFFGDSPVSPTLKSSVANQLATTLV